METNERRRFSFKYLSALLPQYPVALHTSMDVNMEPSTEPFFVPLSRKASRNVRESPDRIFTLFFHKPFWSHTHTHTHTETLTQPNINIGTKKAGTEQEMLYVRIPVRQACRQAGRHEDRRERREGKRK
mmetsp:Transcript_39989/g.78842  ORF Transcript_39989/g.78842 Transcript_39989/m.78842 type:complete len:129 (-) Transcript_39989:733-1119(-)